MTPDMTRAEWAACTDADKPVAYTETLGSDCISFTDNLSRIRVRTTVVPWNTTFAEVIGFDTIGTSAFAEVNTPSPPTVVFCPSGCPAWR